MNEIKRAIIMAAGKGTRMQPITFTTPKPLVSINGKPMIETIIESLHENNIFEIYVVVGYLHEKFNYLSSKYDGLTLIYNEYYDTCNNISSLYAARDHMEDAIILDGDQIIYNQSILSPFFNHSGYCSVYVDHHTDEWLQTVENGIVTACSRTGGSNGWQLYSVSKWNREDAIRLKKHLEYEFEINHNDQIYWDDIALFCYPDEFRLGIYPIHSNDIIEIDSIKELADLDSSYKKYI